MKHRLAGALAALALLVAACSSGGGGPAKPSELVGGNGSGSYDGMGMQPPQPRPSFTLLDTSDKPFAFGTRTSGHPTFLFFGYTHCPDVCPETMANVRLALQRLPAAVVAKTYVVFVSTDVKRDTGPVLTQWIGQFTPGSKATWIGLHGTQAQIDAAQAAAHVTVAQDGGMTHSAEVLLYGPDDYAHVMFMQSNNQVAQMAHDLSVATGTGS